MLAMFAGAPKLTFDPVSRAPFDYIMGAVPAPEGVVFEEGKVGGVPGWWARPKQVGTEAAILYLHCGGYVIGSATAYKNFVGHIAERAGAVAFIADYALAPERPFPAALDDFKALFEGVVSGGFKRIALVGDSAGAGLILSQVAVGAVKTNRVAAIVALSPWIDLTLASESLVSRAEQDPILSKETLAQGAAHFLGKHSSKEPRLAILNIDISAMPPVLIHVGDAEVLLDDSLRFAENAKQAGVDAEVHVWEGMIHVFPSNFAMLNAAAQALANIGEFLTRQLART
jgi:acetyl esterase/lipase